MTEQLTIYHNPRCSKSRQTLNILQDELSLEPQIIRYLETPPDAETLSQLLQLLDLTPRQLMRKDEQEYKTLNLADEQLGNEQLIQTMTENPRLIERPIVVYKGKAVIGRPPETVRELFE